MCHDEDVRRLKGDTKPWTLGMKAVSRETHVRDALVLEPCGTACCSLVLPVVSFYCLDGREAPKGTGASRIMATLTRRHTLGLTVSAS